MKKEKKDIFIVGLALFGSYFGAGNLIFPSLLGFLSGSQWSLAAIGFCISADLMPVVGLYVISKMAVLLKLWLKIYTKILQSFYYYL